MTTTKKTIHIRKPYDAHKRVRVSFPSATPTKQSFKDSCDINKIMRRYENTGLIEHAQSVRGAYGDFTGVSDYHTSINRVMAAQDAFMALPAAIRKRFDNEPSELLAFLDDPANEAEAVELGLIPSQAKTVAKNKEGSHEVGEPATAVQPDPGPAGPEPAKPAKKQEANADA